MPLGVRKVPVLHDNEGKLLIRYDPEDANKIRFHNEGFDEDFDQDSEDDDSDSDDDAHTNRKRRRRLYQKKKSKVGVIAAFAIGIGSFFAALLELFKELLTKAL